MSTILFKKNLFVLHKLFNTIILYLIPKKLRTYISASWYPYSQQQQQQHKTKVSVISSSLSSGIQHKMDPNELKRIFELFDKNGDGRITKKELNDSLQNMGIFIADDDLSQMIQKIDVNGDGSVDVDEFGSLYRAIMDEQDVEGDMKEAFSVFDQNGDGFITVDELKSVLASLGLKQGRTAEDCKQMIMKVDVDGDGMVNLSEFKRMMRGGGFNALTN